SEIAFKTAALMAFREAYQRAKPTILEPIMLVEVQFPEEFQGTVMGQINQRRGTILSTEKLEGFVQAMSEVPPNDMFGYSTDLRSATQGKGECSMEVKRYAAVPTQQRAAMMAEIKRPLCPVVSRGLARGWDARAAAIEALRAAEVVEAGCVGALLDIARDEASPAGQRAQAVAALGAGAAHLGDDPDRSREDAA